MNDSLMNRVRAKLGTQEVEERVKRSTEISLKWTAGPNVQNWRKNGAAPQIEVFFAGSCGNVGDVPLIFGGKKKPRKSRTYGVFQDSDCVSGGRCKFRTCDPCSVNAVLYP